MSLWVYNLGAAQRDGSSALSWAYSRVGDGWLLTDCSFTWDHSALPHLPVFFQQILKYSRQGQRCRRQQAKACEAVELCWRCVCQHPVGQSKSHGWSQSQEVSQVSHSEKIPHAKSPGEGGKNWVITAIYCTLSHLTLRSVQCYQNS